MFQKNIFLCPKKRNLFHYFCFKIIFDLTKTANTYKDAQIWDSFREGDNQALSCIYSTHIQVLFKYGLKISLDEAFVMDCIHDLFVDMIRHRATVGRIDNIRHYLIRSLRHKMFRNLKSKRTELFDDYPFLLESAVDDRLYEQETNHHQRLRLREAINKLPERQKEVIYLRYIMDFKNEEIAQIMEISHQSVRNMLHKAIENLRKNMSKEDLILFISIIRKLHI